MRTLTKPQADVVIEALSVCLDTDTFLDDPAALLVAESLLHQLEDE